MTPNQKAFLDLIANSEIGVDVLAGSDDGYNVLVGSTPHSILTFDSYERHPMIYNQQLNSTAAGRYQLLGKYFNHYRIVLDLPDFGPDSQDKIALQQIRECHALDNIASGNIRMAVAECSRIWASLPGNSYGQHQNNIDDLIQFYIRAGGTLS